MDTSTENSPQLDTLNNSISSIKERQELLKEKKEADERNGGKEPPIETFIGEGGFKTAYSINNKIIHFYHKGKPYLYSMDELVLTGFIKAFEGISAKIISQNGEKQYQDFTKRLANISNIDDVSYAIETTFLLQSLMIQQRFGFLSETYLPTLSKKVEEIIEKNKNNQEDSVTTKKARNLSQLLSMLITIAKTDIYTTEYNYEENIQKLEECWKNFFDFFNDPNNGFKEGEAENLLIKLFCFVLFTNKLDIKPGNILISDDKKIHVDLLINDYILNHDNNVGSIKPMFDNYCFNKNNTLHHLEHNFDRKNLSLMNNLFFKSFLKSPLFTSINEEKLINILKQYIITPSKIKQMIGEASKNIIFGIQKEEKIRDKEAIQCIKYYLLKCRDYNKTLVEYLKEFKVKNNITSNRIDTFIKIAEYNILNLNEIIENEEKQIEQKSTNNELNETNTITNIYNKSLEHCKNLMQGKEDDYLKIEEDKNIDFSSIDSINSSLEQILSDNNKNKDNIINEEENITNNTNINDTSLVSLKETNDIEQHILNNYSDFIPDIKIEEGYQVGFPIDDKDKAICFLDARTVPGRSHYQQNNNNTNNNYIRYNFKNSELISNAFVKVLDGDSAKFIIDGYQKYFTTFGIFLLNKENINLDELFQFTVLIFLYYAFLGNSSSLKSIFGFISPLLCKIEKNNVVLNEFKTTLEALFNDNSTTNEPKTNEEKSNFVKRAWETIFKFYINNKTHFSQSQQTEDFLNQLFYFVLFTNKLDIKPTTVSKNKDGKITHINCVDIDFVKNIDGIPYDNTFLPIFDNSYYNNDDVVDNPILKIAKTNTTNTTNTTNRIILNSINHLFIESYLNFLLENNDEQALLKNLKRYIITPSKIQKIIGEAIKNGKKVFKTRNNGESIDNNLCGYEKENNYLQDIKVFLKQWREYTYSLLNYLKQYLENLPKEKFENEEFTKRLSTIANIVGYNSYVLYSYFADIDIDDVLIEAEKHYNNLTNQRNDNYLKIEEDKEIDFSSIDNLYKSIKEKNKTNNICIPEPKCDQNTYELDTKKQPSYRDSDNNNNINNNNDNNNLLMENDINDSTENYTNTLGNIKQVIRKEDIENNDNEDYKDDTSLNSFNEYQVLKQTAIDPSQHIVCKDNLIGKGTYKNAYKTKNGQVIYFYKKNDNDDLYIYRYSLREIISYAFIKVLEGKSTKIIADGHEKKLLKFQEVKFEPLEKIMLSLVLTMLDPNMLCNWMHTKEKCEKIFDKIYVIFDDNWSYITNPQLKNDFVDMLIKLKDTYTKMLEQYYANFYDVMKRLPQPGVKTNLAKIKKIEGVQEEKNYGFLAIKNMLSEIFKFYNTYKDEFSERTKKIINKLFFFVLFTNKLDIKHDNVLFDNKTNDMVHTDLLFKTDSENSDDDIMGIFEPDCLSKKKKKEEEDHLAVQASLLNLKDKHRFCLINKIFLDEYLELELNSDNQETINENLLRYKLTEEKIKQIIKESVKNLYRCFSYRKGEKNANLEKLFLCLQNKDKEFLKSKMKIFTSYLKKYLEYCISYNKALIDYLNKKNINNSSIIKSITDVAQNNIDNLKKKIQLNINDANSIENNICDFFQAFYDQEYATECDNKENFIKKDEEDKKNINDMLEVVDEESAKKNINDMLEAVDEEDNENIIEKSQILSKTTKYNDNDNDKHNNNVFRNIDATSEQNSKYEHNFCNLHPLKETTKIRETKNWPKFDSGNIKTFGSHNYYEIKNCTNAKKNIQTTHNFRKSKIETK